MTTRWRRRWGRPGFQKRAGFALLACLAGHDKLATDDQFIKGLRLIEAASLAVARRLAASDDPSARWVGKDAVRDLTRPR